jgi:hypothetical protein
MRTEWKNFYLCKYNIITKEFYFREIFDVSDRVRYFPVLYTNSILQINHDNVCLYSKSDLSLIKRHTFKTKDGEIWLNAGLLYNKTMDSYCYVITCLTSPDNVAIYHFDKNLQQCLSIELTGYEKLAPDHSFNAFLEKKIPSDIKYTEFIYTGNYGCITDNSKFIYIFNEKDYRK